MEFDIKKEIFRNIDIFQCMSDANLETLISDCREISLPRGEILFQEGEPGHSMFVVLFGELSVYKEHKILNRKRAGDYFGEMSLIDAKPRSATVKVLSDCLLLEVNEEQFKNHIALNSQALLALLKNLSDRTRGDTNILDVAYKKLRTQEKLSSDLRRILNDTTNEIYIFNSSDLHYEELNARALENIGFSNDEIKTLTPFEVIKGLTPEKFKRFTEPLLLGHRNMVAFQAHHQRKNGSTYPVEVRLQFSKVEGKSLFIAIVQDNSERQEMEDKIRRMAFYDSLTGLPNRNLLNDRLSVALAHAARGHSLVALLLLDMDNFKRTNDSLGHHAGDLLLQDVARRLTQCVRKQDTVARMGGDEFVVLLTDISQPEDAIMLARKILKTLEPSFFINFHEIYTGFSIGISVFPEDGMDAQTLLMNADAAMYRAKEKGKNTYQRYSSSMLFKATHQITLESGLRKALEREEFLLHYQPKVCLKTGDIVGVEALLRWEKPGTGLVLPEEIIPVAEESRLIIPIGEWVLRAACRQLKEWEEEGVQCPNIAVNLSGHQFAQNNLVQLVREIIQNTEIDPRFLELEITETILMENSDSAVSMLNHLHEIGIQLSIDDFGTGYSSLTYLHSMPINTLKIAQSFVNDCSKDANRAIIKAIMSLGQTLKLKTIAEGVETAEQMEFLRSVGCDIIQGYYFSKPLPAEDVFKLMLDQKEKKRPIPLQRLRRS